MFPLRHVVGVRVFQEGAFDSHGNPVRSWADPVEQAVYGWYVPSTDEPAVAGHDRVVVDVKVLVPPGFVCGPNDRVVVDGSTFDVVGLLEDYTFGPWGYRPGAVLNLREVSG